MSFKPKLVRAIANGRRLKICVTGPTGSHLIYQRTCHFARLGHDVTFVAEHEVEEPLPGVKVHRIPHAFHEFLGPLKQVFLYRRAIQTVDPDLVLVHYPHGPWGWGAALAGYPLALSIMGGDILFDEVGSATVHDRRATVSTFACADFIAAKSNYIIAELKRLGGFDRKAARILWMIDRRIFRRTDATALRATLGLADDEQVIFSPKSLQRYYNVDLVVEAMPAILKRHPRTRLLISEQSVQPDYKSEIEARIAELGIGDRVLFIGSIPNERMPEFFSLAAMTVAIPPADGLPMAYLEAMACGTVNVVSRLENTKEIVTDGHNALAVDITADAVARAAIRLFEEHGLRERLIKGGLETIDQLPSLQEELELIERRFVGLVDRPRTPPPRELRREIIRASYRYSWARLRGQHGRHRTRDHQGCWTSFSEGCAGTAGVFSDTPKIGPAKPGTTICHCTPIFDRCWSCRFWHGSLTIRSAAEDGTGCRCPIADGCDPRVDIVSATSLPIGRTSGV